jgi:hypothetical protein
VAAVVQAALWASSTTSLDDAGVLRTADQQSRRGTGDGCRETSRQRLGNW